MKETTENLKDEGVPVADGKEVEIGFDEAAKYDALDSNFFKPESNTEYKLTFNSWRLIRKPIPDYNDKTKIIEKTILELGIETINDQVPRDGMVWGITSRKCREAFESMCKYPEDKPKNEKNIMTKLVLYKHKGEGKERTYTVNLIGDKPAHLR